MKGIRFNFAVILCLATLSCSRDPVDYDDCILRSLSAGTDKAVAGVVMTACRNKYPEKGEDLVVLPEDARARLTGRFAITGTSGHGNIYNGNEDWRVEEVIIALQEIREPVEIEGDEENPWALDLDKVVVRVERYLVPVSVPPLASRSFTLQVNFHQDEHYQWILPEARGIMIAPTGAQ